MNYCNYSENTLPPQSYPDGWEALLSPRVRGELEGGLFILF